MLFFIKRFLKKLENFLRRYRAYLKPRSYSEIRNVEVHSEFGDGMQKRSVISMRTTDLMVDGGRYLRTIIEGLLDSGHQVFILKKLWVLSEMKRKRYTLPLIENQKVQFISKNGLLSLDKWRSYLWADHPTDFSNVKNIHVVRSTRKINDMLWIPYPTYPGNLSKVHSQTINTKKKRSVKVFFSGTVLPGYQSLFLNTHSVMSRVEVLETLYQSDLPIRIYDVIKSNKNKGLQGIFLPRYDFKKKTVSGNVARDYYLENLRDISFFICAPGTYMPFAHNVIEAMSQGSIPILEYGSYFSPSLTPGENSLAFHDQDSLISSVKKALDMPEEQVATMRSQVVNYYNDFLRFSSFLERLDKTPENTQVYFNG